MIYLVACVISILLILGYVAYEDLKLWDVNFAEAKKYVSELRFKIGKFETATFEEGVVLFSPRTDEETTKEPLANFRCTEFGKDIKVYVHISENLAFITTEDESMATFLVYEK